MTKVGQTKRQNVGTVLERQVFASANHCPPLRLFQATGQNTVFRKGTFKRIIRVFLMFLGCPLITVRWSMRLKWSQSLETASCNEIWDSHLFTKLLAELHHSPSSHSVPTWEHTRHTGEIMTPYLFPFCCCSGSWAHLEYVLVLMWCPKELLLGLIVRHVLLK